MYARGQRRVTSLPAWGGRGRAATVTADGRAGPKARVTPDSRSCSAWRRCQGGSDIVPGGVLTDGVTVCSQAWPDAGQARSGGAAGRPHRQGQGRGVREAWGSPGARPHSFRASEGTTQSPDTLP